MFSALSTGHNVDMTQTLITLNTIANQGDVARCASLGSLARA